MNQTKEQHLLAVELLKELGLSHIRLQRRKDGSFRYLAWSTPLIDHNGSSKVTRRGIVRVR
jgi:hypothetical protein